MIVKKWFLLFWLTSFILFHTALIFYFLFIPYSSVNFRIGDMLISLSALILFYLVLFIAIFSTLIKRVCKFIDILCIALIISTLFLSAAYPSFLYNSQYGFYIALSSIILIIILFIRVIFFLKINDVVEKNLSMLLLSMTVSTFFFYISFHLINWHCDTQIRMSNFCLNWFNM